MVRDFFYERMRKKHPFMEEAAEAADK